jgi:hypothetical protein
VGRSTRVRSPCHTSKRSLSGPERREALLKIGLLCKLRRELRYSEEEVATKLGFGSADMYPTKCKRLRATLSRHALRRLRTTFRSSQGLAIGYRIPRPLLSQRTRAVPDGLLRGWVVSGDPDADTRDVTRYLSAQLGKLRRPSWPRENRLGGLSRNGGEKRRSHSAVGEAQEGLQRHWWWRVYGG